MEATKSVPTEAEQLKETLLAFIAEEAGMVKDLAAQSKKNPAREVVHLRGLVKTIKDATSRVRTSGHEFGHAEAFALMLYEEQDVPAGAEQRLLRVWNSRDGVTPFVVHVGDLSVAESWHLRIGLRDLATGRFTDEEDRHAAE